MKSIFGGNFQDKQVLVTGHTGFKGAWLCEWLLALGAKVTGFSLVEPPTQPCLHDMLGLEPRLRSLRGDLRDQKAVDALVEGADFDFVFHLGAQALVRRSYADPVGTYATNVMGTVHLLDALRRRQRPCVVVVVSSDKCYENHETLHGYREEDAMGGHDPYSSSKGCVELVVSAFRRSYLTGERPLLRLASARAGNVIGGGDWAEDRIVPDCIRHLRAGQAIPVRNPEAIRPWQHVLEPLSGYLCLAALLAEAESPEEIASRCSGFNFGPTPSSSQTVRQLVEEILLHLPGTWDDRSDPGAPHEARLLNLSINRAFHHLRWQPVWNFKTTVARTAEWYGSVKTDTHKADYMTRSDLGAYVQAAREAGLPWAQVSTIDAAKNR